MLNKITETANYIEAKIEIIHKIAIILGTGLGALVENIKNAARGNIDEAASIIVKNIL